MVGTEPKKILVAVWEPLIGLLNKKVKAACLKRDEFLDHVLKHEAQKLKKEVSERNSDEAKAHISKHLGMLRRKQVNLNLSPETVQEIGDVCEHWNVPRDAFINRVILFLVAGKAFFKLLLDDIDWEWAEGKVIEDYYNYFNPTLDGALPAIQEIVKSDPFQFYRACIEITNDNGGISATLHDAFISWEFLKRGVLAAESAIGFNCHLSDIHIKIHLEHADPASLLEELLANVGSDFNPME